MTHTRIRRTASVLLTLAVAGTLAACSEQPEQASDIVSRQQAQQVQRERQIAAQKQKAYNDLPSRPSGVIDIDGSTRGSLSGVLRNRYVTVGSLNQVNLENRGEDAAFADLCAGKIDLVDSARPISEAEWDACQAVGLDVVQFQIASDAVVVATKNESDVGGDCLSTTQVQDIFRAGSPIVNWSDPTLEFDDLPLHVGGPNPENNDFGFFGRYVLDSPEPSMTDLRSDYRAFRNDDGARRYVVGRNRDYRLMSRFDGLNSRRQEIRRELVGARMERQAAAEEFTLARAERAKGIRDGRSSADQARDQRRLDAASARLAKARGKVTGLTDELPGLDRRVGRAKAARARIEKVRGNVAYYRFTYYELYEEQLRPMEITLPDQQRNCIFPSRDTVSSGDYPLARQLLLTTTTRSIKRTEVRDFLKFALGRAQVEAENVQLVPIPNLTLNTQRAWLADDGEPVLYVPAGAVQAQAQSSATPTPTDKPVR